MIVKELPEGCESCFCSHVDYGYEEYILWCGALDECVTGHQYDRPNNCPLKSVDGSIEKINRKANSGQWSEATVYGMQKAIAIIKEYCEV